MEKGIRTPIALVLSMPCAKFGVLKIHTERDDAKKGTSKAYWLRVEFNYHLALINESARRTVRACTRKRVQGELFRGGGGSEKSRFW